MKIIIKLKILFFTLIATSVFSQDVFVKTIDKEETRLTRQVTMYDDRIFILDTGICENQDFYCGEYIYHLEFEQNDFVYTRSEQTIPNLANTYRIEANHLQEQQWDKNKVPLMQLYSGSEGLAFQVPKID